MNDKGCNYPKVCFGCSMGHIRCQDDEVVSEDGKRSYHVNCVPKEEGPKLFVVEKEMEEVS